MVIMNAKCCVLVLHNVYHVRCDVCAHSHVGRGFQRTHKQWKHCSASRRVSVLYKAFFRRCICTLNTAKVDKKTSVCSVSCSGLCPSNLQDESLMRRSAYRMQSTHCLPEKGVTSKIYCSLYNTRCVLVIRSHTYVFSNRAWRNLIISLLNLWTLSRNLFYFPLPDFFFSSVCVCTRNFDESVLNVLVRSEDTHLNLSRLLISALPFSQKHMHRYSHVI